MGGSCESRVPINSHSMASVRDPSPECAAVASGPSGASATSSPTPGQRIVQMFALWTRPIERVRDRLRHPKSTVRAPTLKHAPGCQAHEATGLRRGRPEDSRAPTPRGSFGAARLASVHCGSNRAGGEVIALLHSGTRLSLGVYMFARRRLTGLGFATASRAPQGCGSPRCGARLGAAGRLSGGRGLRMRREGLRGGDSRRAGAAAVARLAGDGLADG